MSQASQHLLLAHAYAYQYDKASRPYPTICPPFLTIRSAQSKSGKLSEGWDEKIKITAIITIAGIHLTICLFFMYTPKTKSHCQRDNGFYINEIVYSSSNRIVTVRLPSPRSTLWITTAFPLGSPSNTMLKTPSETTVRSSFSVYPREAYSSR